MEKALSSILRIGGFFLVSAVVALIYVNLAMVFAALLSFFLDAPAGGSRIESLYSGPLLTAALAPTVVCFATIRAEPRDPHSAPQKVILSGIRSGSIFMLLVMVLFWSFYFFSNGFPVPADPLGWDTWLFFAEQFLKVLLFDAFEIFQITLSPIQPTSTEARAVVFIVRLVYSLTLAKYIFELIDFEKYPLVEKTESRT